MRDALSTRKPRLELAIGGERMTGYSEVTYLFYGALAFTPLIESKECKNLGRQASTCSFAAPDTLRFLKPLFLSRPSSMPPSHSASLPP